MDKINEIWSNWHTEELLGTGSFGKVYKVKREKMGHISYAAVKVIQIPQDESEVKSLKTSGMDYPSIQLYYEELMHDLMNEICLMESLKTANNVVKIEDYEVVERENGIGWTIYIRMELLTNLNDYIEQQSLSEYDIVCLGRDICNALVNCEKEKIIHRDIKIDNVFVTPYGEFKLGDFGISKQLEKTRSAVSQKGTNMYMAPEIYRGDSYDHTVDIYSLGIMLYRLLNKGRFPFAPLPPQPLRYIDNEKSIQRRMSGEKIPLIPSLDKEIMRILYKACAFKPEDRFSKAEEMLAELQSVVGKASSRTILNQHIVTEITDTKTKYAFGDAAENTDKILSDPEEPALDSEKEKKSNETEKEQVREEPIKKNYRPAIGILAGILTVAALVVAGYSYSKKNNVDQTATMSAVQQVTTQAATTPSDTENSVYEVPNVIGHTVEQAKNMLGSGNVSLKMVEKYDDKVQKGKVVSVSPVAGSSIAYGSHVMIVVSAGIEKVKVPAVKGMIAKKAKSKLVVAKLKSKLTYKYSSSVTAGKVISQSVKAGEYIRKGKTVGLVVSRGSKPAPKTTVDTKPRVTSRPKPTARPKKKTKKRSDWIDTTESNVITIIE